MARAVASTAAMYFHSEEIIIRDLTTDSVGYIHTRVAKLFNTGLLVDLSPMSLLCDRCSTPWYLHGTEG